MEEVFCLQTASRARREATLSSIITAPRAQLFSLCHTQAYFAWWSGCWLASTTSHSCYQKTQHGEQILSSNPHTSPPKLPKHGSKTALLLSTSLDKHRQKSHKPRSARPRTDL